MKYKEILVLIAIFGLIGCNNNDKEFKYQGMTEEQKNNLFIEKKKKIIYKLICTHFNDDINRYQADKRKKEFDSFYFPDYPFQFRVMQEKSLYPLNLQIVREYLKRSEAEGVNPDFIDWEPPNIKELPCQDKIEEWLYLKKEWETLSVVMPNDFFKQYTYWDDLYDRTIELLDKFLDNLLIFVMVASITVYSIVLHFGLLVRRNIEGLWLIIATPLSALYWQRYLKTLLNPNISYWWRVLIASVILSMIYSIVALIIGVIKKDKSVDKYNEIDTKDEIDDQLNTDEITDLNDCEEIFFMIKEGETIGVANLIKRNPDAVNCINEYGQTPLHFLLNKGREINENDIFMAEIIVKNGANINSLTKNEYEWAPLHFLASKGEDTNETHRELTSFLLNHGADPGIRTKQGLTPLHLIAINGSVESIGVLEELLSKKINPFALSDDGVTSWRTLWHHGEEVYALIDAYEKQYTQR